MQNAANGVNVATFQYQYNQANQRTNVTLIDNSQWRYQYDSLGQVTSGKRYWSDSAVAGQQYEYVFDDIGNRKAASSGGNQLGNDLRTSVYTQDLLNRYSNRSTPGSVDIVGEASTGAKVTINNQPTLRHGEYYRGNPEVINTAGPKYQMITNIAVIAGTGNNTVSNTTGYVVIPKYYQTFAYDYDGNLTFDGIWSYIWDAENRLVSMSMTNVVGIPDSARKKLDFKYDWQGRRIAKIVSTWSSGTSTFGSSSTTVFLYDGWNLIAEATTSGGLLKGYLWGLDLSGSMQGAGGVGGLLAVYDSASASTHLAGYDGNGNVSVLVKASDGSVTARYEYGPFGEVIRAMGPMAKTNPFRFSTKFTDDESDLLYYGYRFYSPSMGRWLSRDPLGDFAFLKKEVLGIRLDVRNRLLAQSLYPTYLFVKNDPIWKIDRLGLSILGGDSTKFFWSAKACGNDSYTSFIQVGLGGSLFEPGKFVDDGTHGAMSDSSFARPLYPNGGDGAVSILGADNTFEDTPGNGYGKSWGLTGLKFEVCRVCLKKSCVNKQFPLFAGATFSHSTYTKTIDTYSIISVGPCRTYTVSGKGGSQDLDEFGPDQKSETPSNDFRATVETSFPGVLAGTWFERTK